MPARWTIHWSFLLAFALVMQSLGCGTIMYPERRGQRGGRIDVGVAVLDGIGLLFFLIPGIIAYVVDFGNGTIYLPHHHYGQSPRDFDKFAFDPKGDVRAQIERIVRERTGVAGALGRGDLQAYELKSWDEVPAILTRQDRLASR